jgi:predicted TPR repeat methyltransferase
MSLFDEIASDYDQLRPAEVDVLNTVVNVVQEHQQLLEKRQLHLLDVGCGTGRYSIPLAKKFNYSITGIDTSMQMLDKARRKLPRGQWIKSDIQSFAHGGCLDPSDIILCAYSLHLLDWHSLLGLLAPQLASKGLLIVITYPPETFEHALYHSFIPGLREIDQNRFPGTANIVSRMEELGLKSESKCVVTTIDIRTVRDVHEIVHRARSKYCSTLWEIDTEVVNHSLANMERYLSDRVSVGATIKFRHEHAIVYGNAK